MEFIPVLLKELENETVTTREMLSRIPDAIYDWQPHPKSMTVRKLATHIAELPQWVDMALNTDGLNFAEMDYTPTVINHTADLLKLYDKSYEAGHSALVNADPATLENPWILKNGDTVLANYNKLETIRMAYCQIVHHRAQLGVFLRLNDIAIPPTYGPSADEGSM